MKKTQLTFCWLCFLVGMTRFELAASSSRTKRATGLRYIPNPFAAAKVQFFSIRQEKSVVKTKSHLNVCFDFSKKAYVIPTKESIYRLF